MGCLRGLPLGRPVGTYALAAVTVAFLGRPRFRLGSSPSCKQQGHPVRQSAVASLPSLSSSSSSSSSPPTHVRPPHLHSLPPFDPPILLLPFPPFFIPALITLPPFFLPCPLFISASPTSLLQNRAQGPPPPPPEAAPEAAAAAILPQIHLERQEEEEEEEESHHHSGNASARMRERG